MSLEWFSRMENAVRVSLPDLCEGFDELDILFDTDTTEQHPTFSFSVETDEEYDEFCIVFFDPTNQEFYSYHYDDEADLHAKVLFANLNQMLSFIHASFHDYLEELDEELEDEFFDEDVIEEELVDDIMDDGDEFNYSDPTFDGDEENVQWITNNKYIHIEENNADSHITHSIYYKLGVDNDTGDGVLYRSTISKQDDDETEENMMMYFKEEEAPYISELISEYLNKR